MDGPQPPQTHPTQLTVRYAGFWLRLLAALLDSVAMFIPFCFVSFFAVVAAKLVVAGKPDNGIVMLVVLPLTLVVTSWLYFAILESCPWQASLGKLVFGLCVTDAGCQRLSFARATVRTLAKFLSSITLGLGFLMCGFTKRKQTLHDLLTGCLVLRRSW